MTFDEKITDIINDLSKSTASIEEYEKRNSNCVQQLINLLEKDDEIHQYALYLLDSIEDVEENEFYLNILLQALRDRNQLDAFEDIAAKALLSDGAEDKLDYTECLISIERESTLPLLIQAAAEKKVIVS